jgi:hypothetical protein
MRITNIIAAIASVVSADSFSVPSIEWNVDKVDQIKEEIKEYGIRY